MLYEHGFNIENNFRMHHDLFVWHYNESIPIKTLHVEWTLQHLKVLKSMLSCKKSGHSSVFYQSFMRDFGWNVVLCKINNYIVVCFS